MYQSIDRLDSALSPAANGPDILSFNKQAYNGLNLMQVLAANSLM